MQQPITITLNLQLKLKVKLKDNKAEAEIIDAESEQVEDDDMLLKRKLALMLSTAFAEWSGYPLICNGSKGTNLINYKMWGNSEQNGTPSPTSPVDIISVGEKLLPTGYTQLEYIKGDGIAYLRTPITSYKNTYTYKIGIKRYDTATKFISFQNPEAGLNNIGLYSNAQNGIVLQNGATTRQIKTLSTDVLHDVIIEKDGYTIDGTKQDITAVNEFTVSQRLYLFAGTSPGTGLVDSRRSANAVSYFKVYNENGNIVLDLIPAKNSDNVVGMYDLVSNTFLTNVETSGSFTAGSVKVSYKIPVVASNQDGTETTTTNIYLSAPLRKVGDYADYIDFENKQVVRNVGYEAFTGTESWVLNSGVSGLFQIAIQGSKQQNTAPYVGYCSHFYPQNKSESAISTGQCTFQGTSGSYGRVSVRYTVYNNDLAGFKAWVATQYNNGIPVEVVYPLATPTTESIELPALPTFSGYTKFETSTTVKPSDMYGKG